MPNDASANKCRSQKHSLLPKFAAWIWASVLAGWAGMKGSDYVWENSEMDARQYANVAKAYPTLTPEARAKFDLRLQKGYLLKPEMMKLIEYALETQYVSTLGTATSIEDVESSLHQTYRFFAGIPTESRAKDNLLAEFQALRDYKASGTR